MSTTAETVPDRIEQTITLDAPRARVWRALTDPAEFGEWFRAKLEDAPFTPGARVTARILHPGYEHVRFEMVIERVAAERLLSFRWHPYAIEPNVDYSAEPTTLVEFTLEDAGNGTKVRVTESGFGRIPLERRSIAFRMNNDGWAQQLKNVERYVAT